MPRNAPSIEHEEKADNFCGRPFFEQFKGYYKRWQNDDGLGFSLLDPRQFADAVNKHMNGLRTAGEAFDQATVNRILAGEHVPTVGQLTAICLEFKIYGDLRESLIEQAEAARRERTEAETRRHEEVILPFRRTNPGGNTELPSFAEMLAESYRARRKLDSEETINTLLWDRVFKAWAQDGHDFSPDQFCALITHNNQDKGGKTSLTNNTVYNWRNHPDKYKPIAESVEVICKAFGLAPQNEEPTPQDCTHELMLWHIIDGKPFNNPYPAAQEAPAIRNGHAKNELDAAIDAASATSDHGPLVRALIDASGISMSRLQTLVDCQQLHQWCKGAVIEDVGKAQRFLDIVHQPDLQERPAEAEKQNNKMLGLLTGRVFDLPTLVQEAQKEGIENPGGQLLVLLTGRRGLVTISAEDLAQGLTERGHETSKRKVHHIRSSKFPRREGVIQATTGMTEPLANAILDMVQEKAGLTIDGAQRADCVDILTNCPSPPKLLAQCVEGKLAIGAMVRMTYERKGMTQAEFHKEVELAHTSDFLLGKANLEPESARKIADWLGLEKEDRRKFMVLAMGHQASLDSVGILNEVRAGTRPRVEGLRMIYDASGMSRSELSEESSVDISYSVTETSQGRLTAPPVDMRKLARLCGLGGHEDDFIQTFGAEWVARSSGSNGTAHGAARIKRP